MSVQTQVHELGYAECPKSYVFRGSKEYAPKQIQDMLGLNPSNRPAPRPGQPIPAASFGAARFLMPVQQCEFQLTSILEQLQRDAWNVANDKRPLRCTGVALSVAVGLLEVRSPFWLAGSLAAVLTSGCRRRSRTPEPGSCSSRVDLPRRVPAWSSALSSRSPSDLTTTSSETRLSTTSVRSRSVAPVQDGYVTTALTGLLP